MHNSKAIYIYNMFILDNYYINYKYSKLRKNLLYVFLSAVLIHLFMISNFFVNHDSCLLFYNNANWLIQQGKWFVTPLTSIDGSLNLSYLSSILGLLFYTISSGCFCLIFKLKNSFSQLLTGLLIVSFPSVGTMIAYQSLDYFSLAFLLSVVSTFFIIYGNNKGIILGICLLILSIGAYQPFLGVALSIFTIKIVVDILQNKVIKELYKGFVRYFLSCIISVSVYYLILKIILLLKDIKLSSYKGMNNVMDLLSVDVFVDSLVKCYSDMFGYLMYNVFAPQPIARVSFVNLSCVIISFILIISIVFNQKTIKKDAIFSLIVLAILYILVLPLSVNIVGLLSKNTSFYYISLNSIVVIFLIPLILVEFIKKTRHKSYLCVVTAIILLVQCFLWIRHTNAFYHNLMLINKSYDVKLSVLYGQIQRAPGYKSSDKVFLCGGPPYDFLESDGMLKAFEREYYFWSMGLGKSSYELYSNAVIAAYMTNKLSLKNIYGCSQEELNKKYSIDKLPIYPSQGSIVRVDDDSILVKISNHN